MADAAAPSSARPPSTSAAQARAAPRPSGQRAWAAARRAVRRRGGRPRPGRFRPAPAARVDHRRDAGIGRAHQRQAHLDGADAGLRQMLVRAGDAAEPGVVGHLQDPVGPRGGAQMARGTPPRSRSAAATVPARPVQQHRPRPGAVAGKLTRGDAGITRAQQRLGQRHVFAERHQMVLVVNLHRPPFAVEQGQRVEISACPRPAARPWPPARPRRPRRSSSSAGAALSSSQGIAVSDQITRSGGGAPSAGGGGLRKLALEKDMHPVGIPFQVLRALGCTSRGCTSRSGTGRGREPPLPPEPAAGDQRQRRRDAAPRRQTPAPASTGSAASATWPASARPRRSPPPVAPPACRSRCAPAWPRESRSAHGRAPVPPRPAPAPAPPRASRVETRPANARAPPPAPRTAPARRP
jgi:hypothetical protein